MFKWKQLQWAFYMLVTLFSLFNITIFGLLYILNSMLFSSFSQVGQELGEKSTLEMGKESKTAIHLIS